MTEIINKIYYVGVNDRNKHRFEGLWPLPNGVSYNSYIIDDEKVALVDTVEVDFFTQFLENIHEVIGDREIDYLIINHMEPDHSGSIALIKKYYPNIKIVGNKKTLGMLEGFYGVTDDVVEVKNGETLSLGNHELSFVLIPMVHWPETMVTLDAKNKVLFSGELYNVMVPGTEGELGIMENHEPFVSALKDGVIWARTQQEGGEVLSAAIMGGYVQVLKDRVIVICDKTRQIERINVDRLNKDIPVLEEKIANLSETSIVSRSLLTRKLRWCKVQLAAKEKEDLYK